VSRHAVIGQMRRTGAGKRPTLIATSPMQAAMGTAAIDPGGQPFEEHASGR